MEKLKNCIIQCSSPEDRDNLYSLLLEELDMESKFPLNYRFDQKGLNLVIDKDSCVRFALTNKHLEKNLETSHFSQESRTKLDFPLEMIYSCDVYTIYLDSLLNKLFEKLNKK